MSELLKRFAPRVVQEYICLKCGRIFERGVHVFLRGCPSCGGPVCTRTVLAKNL
jgi:DNA-directed RNA polymerase subunit RPC12/RpoP